MKILITGGAGFIASHVADACVRSGHRVVVIDNLSSGSRKNLNPRAKFYKADIRNTRALEKIFRKEKPNAVIHHAAFISVTASVTNPEIAFENNVMGTLNVLLAFGKSSTKPKRFIFSSTGGAIYGNPKKLPADEHTSPNPFSPYALSKLIDEQMIGYYAKQFGITYVILRYANVYGPRQRSQGGAGIFPIFVSLMKAGTAPTIFGNGSKTRDYVFVEDVARANVLALTRGKNDIVNIATAKEISDGQIYDAIAKNLRFAKPPRYAPSRKGEVLRITLDPRKAKRILGWSPEVKFEEGVEKTLENL